MDIRIQVPSGEISARQRAEFRQLAADDLRREQLRRDRARSVMTLERLRYRGYAHAGTLHLWMTTIGNSARSGVGFWSWVAAIALGMYAAAWGFR